ncbi:hypothetical protein D3C87_1192300 [compost metagenome]
MAILDLLQGHQLSGELSDAGVVLRDADHQRPGAKLGAGLRALPRVPGLHAFARQREDEGAELALLGLEVRGDLLGLLDAAKRELHPAHGARLVIVPLGHHGMQAHELREPRVVDAGRGRQSLGDGRVDVEVATLEHRPSAGIALEKDDLEFGELSEGAVELDGRPRVEERGDHRRISRQAGPVAEEVDDRDVLDHRHEQGIARLGFGPLDRFDGLRPAVAVRGGQDRRLQVRSQVVPVIARAIPARLVLERRVQVGAEAMRLHR